MNIASEYKQRPKNRRTCDLRECLITLHPRRAYWVLHDTTEKAFSGERVFCTREHADEYETRITVVHSLARTKWERERERIPGVTRNATDDTWNDEV